MSRLRALALPVAAIAALLLTTACTGGTMTDDPTTTTEATARSEQDGVEVWDLTGAPSDRAFGIPEGRSAGVHETEEARRVRLELPQGRTLEVEAVLVSFHRAGDGYTIGVRTAQLEPRALVDAFRDVLQQLDVGADAAATLQERIAGSDEDSPERISVPSPQVRLGDLTIGAQAGLAPVAGSGRVVVGGTWG